jgi:hypothetical protein
MGYLRTDKKENTAYHKYQHCYTQNYSDYPVHAFPVKEIYNGIKQDGNDKRKNNRDEDLAAYINNVKESKQAYYYLAEPDIHGPTVIPCIEELHDRMVLFASSSCK